MEALKLLGIIATACVNYFTMTFPLNRIDYYSSATVLSEKLVATLVNYL